MSDQANLGMGPQPNVFAAGSVSSVSNPINSDAVDASKQAVGLPTKDTIERESALIASLYIQQFQMSQPTIVPPDDIDLKAIQLSLDKICLNILDKWSENLAAIAEQKKRDELRAELNPTAQALDVQAATGVIISVALIFLNAIFGKTISSLVEGKNEVNAEKSIANRFSSQLIDWADKKILNGYLLSIIDKLPSAQSLSNEIKKVLAKELEVMLLGSAIAALYKAQIGWLTHEEIFDLIENPSKIQDKNLQSLAILIAEDLKEIPKSSRESLLKTMYSYFDSNPDLEILVNINKSTNVQLAILNNNVG